MSLVEDKQKGPSPILLVAPSLLLLIGYFQFYYKDTRRQLNGRIRDHQSLTAEQPMQSAAMESTQVAIGKIAGERDVVANEQQAIARQLAEVAAQQEQLAMRIEAGVDSAATMRQLNDLFLTSGLAIVKNEVISTVDKSIVESNKDAIGRLQLRDRKRIEPTSLQDGDLSDAARPMPAFGPTAGYRYVSIQGELPQASQAKQQYKITLQGSFPQVLKATNTITEDFEDVLVVGIDLDEIDLKAGYLNWHIVLYF
jgi:hypothetical protein